MIDTYQLHDALRFSGLGPDVPFHATDSSHEMRMRKFLEELGDTRIPDERDDQIQELERELAEVKRDLDDVTGERDKAEADYREAKRELGRCGDVALTKVSP